MKVFLSVLVLLVSVISSMQAQGDTLSNNDIVIPVDSLQAHQQAQMDVPYFKWFAYSLFIPGATILISEVAPVSADTTKIVDQEQYKRTYKKERTEASIYGSVIGVVMALWWGILIL